MGMGCRQVPLIGALLCHCLACNILTRTTSTRTVHIADDVDIHLPLSGASKKGLNLSLSKRRLWRLGVVVRKFYVL